MTKEIFFFSHFLSQEIPTSDLFIAQRFVWMALNVMGSVLGNKKDAKYNLKRGKDFFFKVLYRVLMFLFAEHLKKIEPQKFFVLGKVDLLNSF